MEIMLPDLVEQRRIGTYFKELDNLITLHQRKAANSIHYANDVSLPAVIYVEIKNIGHKKAVSDACLDL